MGWNDDKPADPEQIEETLRRMRDLAHQVRPWRCYLSSRGIDVRPYLKACEDFERVANGEPPPEGGMDAIMKAIGDFVEGLRQCQGFPPKFTEEEARRWHYAAVLEDLDEAARKFAKTPHDGSHRDAMRDGFLALHQQVKDTLQKGGDVEAAWVDLHLEVQTHRGELARRLKFRMAAAAIYWEQMPQEKWDSMDTDARTQLFDVLKNWREEREKVLGELPLEDRRRLEAMEHFLPEDWERPGAFDP